MNTGVPSHLPFVAVVNVSAVLCICELKSGGNPDPVVLGFHDMFEKQLLCFSEIVDEERNC